MNIQDKQEIDRCLAELYRIVNSYNPVKEYYIAAVILSINVIALIVIIAVGVFWGLIILGVGLLPVLYKALTSNDNSTSEKKLAEEACALMNHCVNLYKYSEDDTRRTILTYNTWNNNIPLYQEFISLFPNMASKKLKKLASVKIRA